MAPDSTGLFHPYIRHDDSNSLRTISQITAVTEVRTMTGYNVQVESQQILAHTIVDSRLNLSPEVKEACGRVTFHGDSNPFIPTPCKITESCSALSGLVGALASVAAKERYGIDQKVEIDT